MHIEDFRNYCLAKKAVSEGFPFGEDTLVFKVADRMFALTNLTKTPFSVNLKCNPERAIELREAHEEVQPGYHANKKHWNTINFEGHLPPSLLLELIDHSYDLVVQLLSKKVREKWELP